MERPRVDFETSRGLDMVPTSFISVLAVSHVITRGIVSPSPGNLRAVESPGNSKRTLAAGCGNVRCGLRAAAGRPSGQSGKFSRQTTNDRLWFRREALCVDHVGLLSDTA